MPALINGVLLLDKPQHLSSNHALQRVKRLFNAKKAGHTGSLDPIATGMLPICFGEATKFSQFLLDSDKTYEVTARLGIETNTGDSEGDVICSQVVQQFSLQHIEAVLSQFKGYIEQVPPMFSAIKFQGKPLYKLARQGIQIERKPRHIMIFSLKVLHYEQVSLRLYIHCSKGTYIRSLVTDIGKQLGCGAHVVALRRLAVTPYDANKMLSWDYLETLAQSADDDALQATLLPVESSLVRLPIIQLTSSSIYYLRRGQPVRVNALPQTTLVRLFSDDNIFLGVGQMLADGRVQPVRLLAQDSVITTGATASN